VRLVSGWIDLQVNGYAGVDFNADTLTLPEVIGACERLRTDGVERIFATIITAPMESMIAKINRMAKWINEVPEIGRTIGGLHIEGPFLSPLDGYAGAHPRDAIHPATIDAAKRLVDAGEGNVRLMTLAPECDKLANVTRELTTMNIAVAAGHSNASLDDLNRSIDAGLCLFTHLGNACPNLMPRHDNIIQRVLSLSDRLSISLIADGHHLPGFVLKNMTRCIAPQRIIIVSDAISAAGLGPGQYQLSGQTVHVDSDGATWAECRTHFAGCATTLNRMQHILRTETDWDEHTIRSAMIDNPRTLVERSTGCRL